MPASLFDKKGDRSEKWIIRSVQPEGLLQLKKYWSITIVGACKGLPQIFEYDNLK